MLQDKNLIIKDTVNYLSMILKLKIDIIDVIYTSKLIGTLS